MYQRRVRPQYPGLPRMPERAQAGFPSQPGSVSTTQQPQQQQQMPSLPTSALDKLFAKQPDILNGIIPTGEEYMANYLSQFGAADPIAETMSMMNPMASDLGLLGGDALTAATATPDLGFATPYLDSVVGAESLMPGAEAFSLEAGIAPAMEAASAAPVAEAGLLAGEAAAGAEAAAAATAAAEGGGLLGAAGLGSLGVLGPLAALGLLGYFAVENDWF